MSRFDWRRAPSGLQERFAGLTGQDQWIGFVGELLGKSDATSHENYVELHELFTRFVTSLDRVQPSTKECCVFVSHKSADADLASRIGWIAVEEGFDYWLDVEDPKLITLTGAEIPSPLKEFLIAAIVEMALLNATHLIAVHTLQSHTSMWIPYEIGRAKSRHIWSSQVSGWFEPGKVNPKAGEYTYLMEQLRSEPAIRRWLRSQPVNKAGCCRLPAARKWPADDPQPLPGESGTSP